MLMMKEAAAWQWNAEKGRFESRGRHDDTTIAMWESAVAARKREAGFTMEIIGDVQVRQQKEDPLRIKMEELLSEKAPKEISISVREVMDILTKGRRVSITLTNQNAMRTLLLEAAGN